MWVDMFPSHTLNNGVKIPTVGLGTFQIRSLPGDDIIHKTIGIALKNGYRLIDTAAVYKNEADIGRSLKDFLPKYNLSRQDVFITSKLSPKDHGFDRAEKACRMSIEALGCEYLDLYLIHWPGVQKLKSEDPENSQLRKGSWRALEKLYSEGLVKSIGVSNYTIKHLDELCHYATIVPAVLQVEFHPQLFQEDLLKYCREKGIWLQAYTSLGQGRLIEESIVGRVAALYNRSPAQVLLRWALEHGVGVIPKAVRSHHIQDNICLFDFELSKEDVAALNNMNLNTHFCWNPERVK